MANYIYPLFKQALLNGDTNSDLDHDDTTDGPYCTLVTSAYTYSALHQYYSSLSGVLGTDQRLVTPTTTNGVFDADDVIFTGVSGGTVSAIVIYRKNSGANTTWRLVAYLDTGITGLPYTTAGGDITIQWNSSGIFSLAS